MGDSRHSRLSPLSGHLSDRSAATTATAASIAMVAFQLAGRATRDALFLSTFGVRNLPEMVIAASLLALIVCIGLSMLMARIGPWRLIPRLFLLSALLLVVEWGLAGPSRPVAAILLFLHFSSLGALLVSGFWAIVNERFDPHTARKAIGRIIAGASLGSLLGGILPELVGVGLSLTAMFPVLAILHLVSGVLVHGLRPPETPRMNNEPGLIGMKPTFSARRTVLASPYLVGLATLVILTAMAEGLLDFVFKARATAVTADGEGLLRLFAVFYTITALASILVQTTMLRPTLARLGVARGAALLPVSVSVGALGGLVLPGLIPLILARGTEMVFRNSFFRGSFELLFLPVAPDEKRATKLLIDVGATRLGDTAGAVLIQATLILAAASAGQWLLVGVVGIALAGLVVAGRLHHGYVGALERSLEFRAGGVPTMPAGDASTLLQTVGAFDITQFRSAIAIDRPTHTDVEVVTSSDTLDPELQRLADLGARDVSSVKDALGDGLLTPPLMEAAIRLLAWNDAAPSAIRALRAVVRPESGRLVAHLLNPKEDFSIRRRLVPVLACCPTPEAFEGLFRALSDQRFEVRYRAGRALLRLRREAPDLGVDRERVMETVLREVSVERGIWESRQLIDESDDDGEASTTELLRNRADRSMEHVFSLLALILPSEPLHLAYSGLHMEDPHIRGTALEYLETILPERVRRQLWPFLEPEGRRPGPSGRTKEEALKNLLASRESIVLAMAKQEGAPENRQ